MAATHDTHMHDAPRPRPPQRPPARVRERHPPPMPRTTLAHLSDAEIAHITRRNTHLNSVYGRRTPTRPPFYL